MSEVWRFEEHTPDLHPSVFLAPGVQVVGRVTLDEDVNLWHGTVLRGDVERIEVGARTNIQDLSVVHVTTDVFCTSISHDVTVGHRAMLHGCRIDHHCLIGMGAIVMDDVHIGPYSIVAAGALLSPGTRIPEGSLVVGSPGRVRRAVTDAERRNLEHSAEHYVRLAQRHVLGTERVDFTHAR